MMAMVAVGVLVVVVGACGDDTDSSSSDTTAADSGQQADLLGPENAAAGEPVRVGFVTDGATAAFDTRDETRAAQATVEYWNAHRGGVGGRPIELVTCETGGDPAGGTDCGNQLVSDDVVAVVFGTSAVAEQAWGPLHDAGVPTMLFQATAENMNRDPDSTFLLVNPLPTLFGLPISVAQRADADKVAFVVIDVPVAVNAFEADGPDILDNAGLDYQLVRVPPGTADMTVQMQQLVDDGAGVVHILGNDTFCIAALQGLKAAAYDGEIVAVSQCITDATRQAIPGEELAGISIISGSALGAADDPTYQLYEAVMGAYGDDVTDPESNIPMGAYTVMGALATSLEGMSGDITPETVTAAIKAMPEQELPGGGGVMFRCGGSAMTSQPAVCTNQWLRAILDADGRPASYEVEDSSDVVGDL
jgi:branched-chain amino acid transport system substrate-binding protein